MTVSPLPPPIYDKVPLALLFIFTCINLEGKLVRKFAITSVMSLGGEVLKAARDRRPGHRLDEDDPFNILTKFV